MNASDHPSPQPADPAAPATGAPIAPQPRILLVDDDLINQKVMVNLLKRKAWTAVAAGSGRRCLELLAAEPFDLVLLDIQMPEMDGFETAKRIREQEAERTAAAPSTPRVPIVALTTVSQPGTREKCLSYGMNEHLTKPVNTAELYALIERILHPPSG